MHRDGSAWHEGAAVTDDLTGETVRGRNRFERSGAGQPRRDIGGMAVPLYHLGCDRRRSQSQPGADTLFHFRPYVSERTHWDLPALRGPPELYYYALLVLCAGQLWFSARLTRGRAGYYWRAIREDEAAAQARRAPSLSPRAGDGAALPRHPLRAAQWNLMPQS